MSKQEGGGAVNISENIDDKKPPHKHNIFSQPKGHISKREPDQQLLLQKETQSKRMCDNPSISEKVELELLRICMKSVQHQQESQFDKDQTGNS